MSPGAYLRVMEAARTRLPVETFGALVGRAGSRDANGQEWTVIEAAIPVKLVPSGTELTPDMSGWNELTARAGLTSRGGSLSSPSAGAGPPEARRIVGWFYSDPAIGIFEPRIDFAGTGRLLAENGSLLLLIDPVANQGGFYAWQDGRFVETGGFYQTGSGEVEPEDIPWSGQVRGAAGWLGSAGTSFRSAQGGPLPPNVPTGASAPGGSIPGESTLPVAPRTPGQNGSVGAAGYVITGSEGAYSSSQEAGEVLYLHRPASRDLTTGPLSEDATAEPTAAPSASETGQRQAGDDLQPSLTSSRPSSPSSLAYVSPSLNSSGTLGAPHRSDTVPNGGFIATPAKRDRRPLVALVGALLGILVVAALAASLLVPQFQSNTLSQEASTPTALAASGAQSTATIPPTAVAAVVAGTPSPAQAAALSSSTPGQVAATATEPPATATAVPSTAVAQQPAAPSPTGQAAQEVSTASPSPTLPAGTPYTVKSGDNLSSIARRFGTTAKAIMDANNLQSTLIRIGQVLVIPPPNTPTPGRSATPTP